MSKSGIVYFLLEDHKSQIFHYNAPFTSSFPPNNTKQNHNHKQLSLPDLSTETYLTCHFSPSHPSKENCISVFLSNYGNTCAPSTGQFLPLITKPNGLIHSIPHAAHPLLCLLPIRLTLPNRLLLFLNMSFMTLPEISFPLSLPPFLPSCLLHSLIQL